MYAGRREWPLDDVDVELKHTKLPRTATPSDDDPPRDRVHVRLGLHGDLDEAQRERLLEIAGRCPVNRALDAGVRIVKELREATKR